MKNFLSISAFILSASTASFAQASPSAQQPIWEPIGLTVSGNNKVKGIEATYQLTKCNGEDVILMKLVNHNDYAVTVEWNPAIFTNELKWIRKESVADKKSVSVNPKGEAAGDCSFASPQMIFRLKDFSVSVNDFKRFGISDFSIITK